MTTNDSRSAAGSSGWAAFAGVLLFMVGSLNALWGLAGILNDDVLIVGGQGALIADITTWGWVHLVLGSIIAMTGVGLLSGSAAARVPAVAFVAVNAIVSPFAWERGESGARRLRVQGARAGPRRGRRPSRPRA